MKHKIRETHDAITEFEGEVFNHRILWNTARELRKRANEDERGSTYLHIGAMLMARATVEGYVNFLLDVLDRKTFQVEHTKFQGNVDAKIKFACDLAGYGLDRARRPYQTVSKLQRFRDGIMHAKPETYSGSATHPASAMPPPMQSGKIMRAVSKEKCERAMEDAEVFCEALHKAALRAIKSRETRWRLGEEALSGPTQFQSRTTKLRQ